MIFALVAGGFSGISVHPLTERNRVPMTKFKGEMIRTLIAIERPRAPVMLANVGSARNTDMDYQALPQGFHKRWGTRGVIALERTALAPTKPTPVSIVETSYEMRQHRAGDRFRPTHRAACLVQGRTLQTVAAREHRY